MNYFLTKLFLRVNRNFLPSTGFSLVREMCPEIVILFICLIINGKNNSLVNLPTLSVVINYSEVYREDT